MATVKEFTDFEAHRAGRDPFWIARDAENGHIEESTVSLDDAFNKLLSARYMSDIQAAYECRWGAD